MPARTVVLERLSKFNGETHAELTAGEYTQLTGRAGRRGIDVEGHAVVLWGPEVDPGRVAGLASTRTYPLRSSFRPSYNMAVNLVGQMGRPSARHLLESSFAQFQADRGVSGLVKQIRRNEKTMAEYAAQANCHLGDIVEYASIRRQISEREANLSRNGGQGPQGRSGPVTRGAQARRRHPGDIGAARRACRGARRRTAPARRSAPPGGYGGEVGRAALTARLPRACRGSRQGATAEEHRVPLTAGTSRRCVEPARAGPSTGRQPAHAAPAGTGMTRRCWSCARRFGLTLPRLQRPGTAHALGRASHSARA